MGYETNFTLEVQDGPNVAEHKIVDTLVEISSWFNTKEEVEEFLDFGMYAKWYAYNSDMKELSSRFPQTLFVLYGDGEESNDFFKNYYLGGMCQSTQGEIVYEEFNEEKLV